jgi:peptidoglycan/xylan/chitin deacetylase (PgdA/CDA1 family)
MKELILNIFFYTGILRFWNYIRRDKLTIITLHGVMDSQLSDTWIPLRKRPSREVFDKGLSLLLNYFNFISMDEAIDMLNGKKPLVHNACVVTFDDGQLNNLSVALPILQKHKIPVVFYPSTAVIDNKSPYWFDRLDFAIQQPGLNGFEIDVNNTSLSIDQSSRLNLRKSLYYIIYTLKYADLTDNEFQDAIDSICCILEEKSGKSIYDLGTDDLWSSPLSWEDIKKCGEIDDVTIGCHTVNHVRLPFTDDTHLNDELNTSKMKLEEVLGEPCVHFCYPNGDWDARTIAATKDSGFVSAVTTNAGWNSVGDDLYTLKRVTFPNEGSAINTVCSLTGLIDFLNRFRPQFK